MTNKPKTRKTPAAPALTNQAGLTFLEFLEMKLIEVEDAARRGVPGMAEKADCFTRVLASAANEQRPAPKHYGNPRPSLADFDHAGEEWGNA